MDPYTLYVLRSDKSNKRYVGITKKKAIERLKEHNSGSNQFTKNNIPWKLVYFEQGFCKTCALRRENFFKTGQGRMILDCIEKGR